MICDLHRVCQSTIPEVISTRLGAAEICRNQKIKGVLSANLIELDEGITAYNYQCMHVHIDVLLSFAQNGIPCKLLLFSQVHPFYWKV